MTTPNRPAVAWPMTTVSWQPWTHSFLHLLIRSCLRVDTTYILCFGGVGVNSSNGRPSRKINYCSGIWLRSTQELEVDQPDLFGSCSLSKRVWFAPASSKRLNSFKVSPELGAKIARKPTSYGVRILPLSVDASRSTWLRETPWLFWVVEEIFRSLLAYQSKLSCPDSGRRFSTRFRPLNPTSCISSIRDSEVELAQTTCQVCTLVVASCAS